MQKENASGESLSFLSGANLKAYGKENQVKTPASTSRAQR